MRAAPPLCALGVFCLLLGGCADTAGEGPPHYVVQPQDTLYSIAWRHDLDFHDLARWNHIGSDYRIAVGQVLTLAPAQGRSATPPPTSSATATPRAKAAPVPRVAPRVPPPLSAGAPFRWMWPTERGAAPRPVPGGGVLLFGRLGQDVKAAAAGRVVYNGDGIRGYGNLIIVKHDDTWLSAYAHVRESLVKEGQALQAGEVIAHMGEGAPGSPTLYFEIRENGKPVDPIALLPLPR